MKLLYFLKFVATNKNLDTCSGSPTWLRRLESQDDGSLGTLRPARWDVDRYKIENLRSCYKSILNRSQKVNYYSHLYRINRFWNSKLTYLLTYLLERRSERKTSRKKKLEKSKNYTKNNTNAVRQITVAYDRPISSFTFFRSS